MTHDQLSLLKEIQEMQFAATELTLYLDTHPDDQRALTDYNMYTKKLQSLQSIYCQQIGPLMVFGFCPSRYPWEWVYQPWPWEICY